MDALLYYRWIVGQRERHAEIVCRQHYDQHAGAGGFFAPLSDAEKDRGHRQVVTPYTGDRGCGMCHEEQEGTAA